MNPPHYPSKKSFLTTPLHFTELIIIIIFLTLERNIYDGIEFTNEIRFPKKHAMFYYVVKWITTHNDVVFIPTAIRRPCGVLLLLLTLSSSPSIDPWDNIYATAVVSSNETERV